MTVQMEFAIGTDMNRALIEVMNRLNQVPRYPVDANEPVISVGGGDFSKVIAWFAIAPKPGNGRGKMRFGLRWSPPHHCLRSICQLHWAKIQIVRFSRVGVRALRPHPSGRTLSQDATRATMRHVQSSCLSRPITFLAFPGTRCRASLLYANQCLFHHFAQTLVSDR